MRNDDWKNLTMKELLTISLADIPVQDVLVKLAMTDRAASLAGFSVCAGYLSVIVQRLHVKDPLTKEEIQECYNRGQQAVVDCFLHLRNPDNSADSA